jgi:hypothetical protein
VYDEPLWNTTVPAVPEVPNGLPENDEPAVNELPGRNWIEPAVAPPAGGHCR